LVGASFDMTDLGSSVHDTHSLSAPSKCVQQWRYAQQGNLRQLNCWQCSNSACFICRHLHVCSVLVRWLSTCIRQQEPRSAMLWHTIASNLEQQEQVARCALVLCDSCNALSHTLL
jgi:hypothetical protein